MKKPIGFDLVKIGELAKVLGKPVTTLRYQADSGLIPVRMVSAKGTRWFSLVDFENEFIPKAVV